MTIKRLYLEARERLRLAGCDSPAGDASLLIEKFFGVPRSKFALYSEMEADEKTERAFTEALKKREDRFPLQYILGEWNFMGLKLSVGEGVLVPREDTGTVVEAAAEEIKTLPAPSGIDLCAGSGALALGVASLCPRARITAVELSPAAYSYLKKNCETYPNLHVSPLLGDALSDKTAKIFPDSGFDFITANPPYIPSAELSCLPPEVRLEPSLALNGGPDGLRFYRGIARLWTGKLKMGGLLALEIGDDQAESVGEILKAAGLRDIDVKKDWSGLNRCVTGKRSRQGGASFL